jgi:putative transposase
LTVVDTFSRFPPLVDPSYRANDVVATLESICAAMGYPKTIRVDRGSEFVVEAPILWASLTALSLARTRVATTAFGKSPDIAKRFRALCG